MQTEITLLCRCEKPALNGFLEPTPKQRKCALFKWERQAFEQRYQRKKECCFHCYLKLFQQVWRNSLFCTCWTSGITSSVLIYWPDTGNMMDWKKVESRNFLACWLTLPCFSISSAFQVDIIIDIRPSRPDTTLVRDLVLILKCRKSVNWVIKSHDVQGRLEAIVSKYYPALQSGGGTGAVNSSCLVVNKRWLTKCLPLLC